MCYATAVRPHSRCRRRRGDSYAQAPPAEVSLAELNRRANIIFSGTTGAGVVSGEVAATSAPSYRLVKDVMVLIDSLPDMLDNLFDRTTGRALQRQAKNWVAVRSASGSRGWLGDVQRIGRSPRTHHLGEVVLKRAVGVRCRFPAAVRRYTVSSPASRDRLVPSCNSCSVCQVQRNME